MFNISPSENSSFPCKCCCSHKSNVGICLSAYIRATQREFCWGNPGTYIPQRFIHSSASVCVKRPFNVCGQKNAGVTFSHFSAEGQVVQSGFLFSRLDQKTKYGSAPEWSLDLTQKYATRGIIRCEILVCDFHFHFVFLPTYYITRVSFFFCNRRVPFLVSATFITSVMLFNFR